MVARKKKHPPSKDKTPAIAKRLTDVPRVLAHAAAYEFLHQQTNEAAHETENIEK